MIHENIKNVYDFIDKTTAIAIYHQEYYENGKIRVFNYGFHSNDNYEILYCVADTICDNRTFRYVMRERLFGKHEICSLCNLNENELPLSLH